MTDDQDIIKTLDRFKPRPVSDAALERIRRSVAHQSGSRPERRFPLRLVAVLAAAACVVAAAPIYWVVSSSVEKPLTTGAPVMLTSGWSIAPTGAALFRVIDDGRVELDRGELFVSSVRHADKAQVRRLVIQTPAGAAYAQGTRFYIGAHAATNIPNSKGTPSMKKLTRVLVLAGAVTLTNALGSVTGGANDLLAAEANKAPAKIVAQANSDFAIDYYKQQAKTSTDENIFFSPYSISTCLIMVQEGARGQTAQEIGNVLGFPKAAQRTGPDSQLIPWQTSLIHSGLADIDSRLVSRVDPKEQARLKKEEEELSKKFQEAWARFRDLDHAGKKVEAAKAMKEAYAIDAQIPNIRSQIDRVQLITANALWVEKTYGLSQNFVDTLNRHYKTGGAYESNFHGDADTERQRINDWVAQQTQGLIADLLPRGSVSDQTRAVLTNTIYFNARWTEKFDPDDTKDRDFHLADGQKVSAPMMTQEDVEWCRFGAFTKDGRPAPADQDGISQPGVDGFRVLEMPYKNGTASMLLIAPEKPTNLAAIESLVTPQAILEWTNQLKQPELRIIMIPKFKIRTGYLLKDQLSALGMPLAFDNQQADFTGMQATPSKEPLYLDQVYHQAFLEVSEDGTIAAAATAATMNRASEKLEVRPEFRADRPFLFMIRDNETGVILFMGRMLDPRAK